MSILARFSARNMDQPAGKHPENPWLGKHVLIEMMSFIMAIYQQNFDLSCLDNATWQDSKIRSGLEPADVQVDLLISFPGLIHTLVNQLMHRGGSRQNQQVARYSIVVLLNDTHLVEM